MSLLLEPSKEQIKEEKLYQQMGVSDDEFALIESILGRLPNYTEIGIFSVMWSEHCSYKNSKPILRKFPTSGERVLQGPGEGAGIVDIGDNQAVVFKIESHNHPSALEPYQGAATGVGGIIRDVFSMGARPIAVLNSLRFGELTSPRVKYLFEEVVAGIAGYGNCIGIPTVGGEVQFDSSYEGNPLVNAMCVGLINHEDIKKGQAKGVGNTVMYVGAKTGRDGIHGATFASEEMSDSSEEKRSAVQVGDPFMEKLASGHFIFGYSGAGRRDSVYSQGYQGGFRRRAAAKSPFSSAKNAVLRHNHSRSEKRLRLGKRDRAQTVACRKETA